MNFKLIALWPVLVSGVELPRKKFPASVHAFLNTLYPVFLTFLFVLVKKCKIAQLWDHPPPKNPVECAILTILECKGMFSLPHPKSIPSKLLLGQILWPMAQNTPSGPDSGPPFVHQGGLTFLGQAGGF
jgi:hypothetical protein